MTTFITEEEEDRQIAEDIVLSWHVGTFIDHVTTIAKALANRRTSALELGKEANRASTILLLAELDRALQEVKADNYDLRVQLATVTAERDAARLRAVESEHDYLDVRKACQEAHRRADIEHIKGRREAFDEALELVATTGSYADRKDITEAIRSARDRKA